MGFKTVEPSNFLLILIAAIVFPIVPMMFA
jgi:hypothetical protein